MGEYSPTRRGGPFQKLLVRNNMAFLRRRGPIEMFQVYDLDTGALKRVVTIDRETVKVTFPSRIWTAGETVPFEIDFDSGGRRASPRWRVWARPLECLDYRELRLVDGKLHVPPDCTGLYLVKVTPEVSPWQRGPMASEYLARGWVEIRSPGAKGSAAVCTPQNRVHYSQGEEIPFSVIVRGPGAGEAGPMTVRLVDAAGDVVAEDKDTLEQAAAALSMKLSPALTTQLCPGRYRLTVEAEGLTGVPQPLVIGSALKKKAFHGVLYGDYTYWYPQPGAWDAADIVGGHVERLEKLGFNLITDRVGWPGANALSWPGTAELEKIARRLQADPTAVGPEKASLSAPFLQTLAAYGARGIEEMGILLYMDAGLPLGGGFDRRTPDQMVNDLARVTKAVLPYSAFRGWTWSSNWWVYNHRGAAAARTPEEKKTYEAAIQRARETGAWDPALEEVCNYRLSFAVEAQDLFAKALKPIAPHMVTAVAVPYRNVEAYPPITLANVDEIDLQAQWEQVPYPLYNLHNAEFYKRPGKRAWDHPETTCDSGTGDQILAMNFQSLMRGADGVGTATGPLSWAFIRFPDDPRICQFGMPSVYRSLARLLDDYGAWLASLEKNDLVAIPASGRMFKVDRWGASTGHHFSNLLEAYISCLYAHYPASIVFVEDMKPDTLKNFKAVLLVDQRIEPEPALADALKAAQAAGIPIFYDGQCREKIVEGYAPLGLSFDNFAEERGAAQDYAHLLFARFCKENAPLVAGAFSAAIKPVAETESFEVLFTERKAEEGRYLFVLNNTTPDLNPGLLWRVNLFSATRLPVRTTVRLASGARNVYDVFAGKRVTPEGGAVDADLTGLPLRVFAILPEPIDRVALRGPGSVKAGQAFTCEVQVLDPAGRPIRASVPVRIRLLSADGGTLYETVAAVGSRGGVERITTFMNPPAGEQRIEATELFTGRSARLTFPVTRAAGPVRLAAQDRPTQTAAPPRATGEPAPAAPAAVEDSFGPHVRSVTVAENGSVAIMNAMNWDNNLYAVDTASGEIRWQQRVGHYFAFAPQALAGGGVAVQGYDLKSAEGYHLYLVGADGRPERRFALYGLPVRLPSRFIPSLLSDVINLGKDPINAFAVAPDGRWVAAAGDLGLAVWSRDGRLHWSQDWWKSQRHHARLLALDASTLAMVDRMTVTACDASNGKELWRSKLADSGRVVQVTASRDGRTCAVLTDINGGRIHILRDGEPRASFPSPDAHAVALSPDASHLAVTAIPRNNSPGYLKLYSVASGLRWTMPGDCTLHYPTFSPDGSRVAAASSLGTLYVVSAEGAKLLERDLGALPFPAWLPDGDLLVGTWMGTVCRLGKNFEERWRTILRPAAADARGKLLADEGVPTTRISSYGNAEPEPAPITPNLLSKEICHIQFKQGRHNPHARFTMPPDALMDGSGDPPEQPWLSWKLVGDLPEMSPINYIEVITYDSWLRVRGITFFEDPAHPESWLRDVGLEYWDPEQEQWLFVRQLLSDAAMHTHKLAEPVESSRFRLTLPWSVCGNVRLGEIVLHGENLGSAHPDVRAGRPVAVLVDEKEDLKQWLSGGELRFEAQGAFSGSKFLYVGADTRIWGPHAAFAAGVPGWRFRISRDPKPGEYRYLQFAWKGLAKESRGINLTVYPLQIYAGDFSPRKDWSERKIGDQVPQEWQIVRIDLAETKVSAISRIGLNTVGGPCGFDQILLGRTEKDLEEYAKTGAK